MSDVLFRKVETAVKETQPDNAAIDIGLILTIISTLLPIIKNCFGGAKAAIKTGGDAAMVAAWRAVVASGYKGDRGQLAMKLVEQGKNATDAELSEAMETASMFPSTLGCILIAAAMAFGACKTTFAGPLSKAADLASTWSVAEVKPSIPFLPKVETPKATAKAYQPSGYSRPWTEQRTGTTSFEHLVGHGYDPNLLRNTPRSQWNYLHGDAHERRQSRIVTVQQPMRQTVYYTQPACPNGYCPSR